MSARIFCHAKQFFKLAEAAQEVSQLSVFPHAVICNYCFFLELAFKALSPSVSSTQNSNVSVGALLANTYPSSSLRGHNLNALFGQLNSDIRALLKDEYLPAYDFDIDLTECSSYFEQGRYAFESSNSHSYNISTPIRLARHVCKRIEKNGAELNAHLIKLKRTSP